MSGGVAETPRPPSILETLEFAKREFLFAGGCTMTDRPDLPLSPDTSWTNDFSQVVAAIDDAIETLVGAEFRNVLRSVGCSTCPPMARISARTKYVPAHQGSHTPEGGRS